MNAPAGRQGILSLTIKDKSALYAAYMPFVRNGGLFIPTNKSYGLGDEVFMLLTLIVLRVLVFSLVTRMVVLHEPRLRLIWLVP